MEAEPPGKLSGHAAAAAVAAPVAVPEGVARLDGHEREALERSGRLAGSRGCHFGWGGAPPRACQGGIRLSRLGGALAVLLPGFLYTSALFFLVLGARDKLDGVGAPAVVESLQRTAAGKANANRRLCIAPQGLSLALPPVAGDITEMAMAHGPPLACLDWQESLPALPDDPANLGKAKGELAGYGSSLPPLTLVTVTLPVFRSVVLMV